MDDRALVGNVEHGIDAADAKTEANESAQFDDLCGGVLRVHPLEELSIHVGVRKRETFGELDRKAFSIRERVEVVVLVNNGVFGLGDKWLRTRRSSGVQSNGALVDLSDSHASQFAFAHGQGALIEHR